MKKIVLLFTALLIIGGCASVPSGFTKIDKEDLSKIIDEIFQDSLFSHAHWGVLVESLSSEELIFEKNTDRMFMPASNEKIPTSAAALTRLGPEYRFETVIGYRGILNGSALIGDLIIIGEGDPTISDRVFEKTTTIFETWADSLKSFGIDTIKGNIVGDDNKFDDEHIGYGWTHGGLDNWYSAEFGALQFNENYVDLMFYPPASEKDTLMIIPDIESDYYKLLKNIEITDTGNARLSISREYGTNDIIIEGVIPRGYRPFERSPTITNPTKFYVTVLKEVLERKGITVTGNSIDCDEIKNYSDSLVAIDTLLIHYSPSLHEMLKILMKRSQNLYAETMVRILGFKEAGIGSFKEGKKVVENVLSDFGVEPNTYAFMDGSGLSRYNYISPRQIVQILKGMKKGPYWETWYDIQPIAGVDGTIRYRMIGTKAEGNVRAKTGTISNVRGLSGYVRTSEGEEIVFSFLVNGHLRSSRETNLITDKALEVISGYPILRDEFLLD